MQVYSSGETVITEITTKSGTALTNVDSVSVDIYAPNGSKLVDGEAATNTATGTYRHTYTLGSGTPVGQYKVEVTVTDGSNITKEVDFIRVDDRFSG